MHRRFLERFLAACRSLPVGDPTRPGTVVGPVIDAEAREKVLGYVERGRREAQLAWQGGLPEELVASGGFYVPPTVFTDVEPGHVIAREEIFGPVLSVLRARDLDRRLRAGERGRLRADRRAVLAQPFGAGARGGASSRPETST